MSKKGLILCVGISGECLELLTKAVKETGWIPARIVNVSHLTTDVLVQVRMAVGLNVLHPVILVGVGADGVKTVLDAYISNLPADILKVLCFGAEGTETQMTFFRSGAVRGPIHFDPLSEVKPEEFDMGVAEAIFKEL